MRRFLSLFTMLMLCGILAFAQSRVVTGRVTDKNGKPIPFASVLIKGSNTGVQTDINGEYSIRVNTGDVLVVSSQSFDSNEFTMGTGNTQIVSLDQKVNTIQEVIVTSAFQTKRTLRSQSSNVQNVSSEQLNTVRATNINNALAGKVAGAQIRSQSAVALGRETAVRLRGENGLGAGSGPIYVVDGTVIPSAGDINMDDVEDVTILQGPAAAGLFGPDGSNGAIVITMKRARKNQPGIGIEINSGVVFDKIYITPNYQNAYSGGVNDEFIKYEYRAGDPEGWKALDGKRFHDYSDDASWGPRISGQEYIPWYAWYPGSEYSFKTASLTPQPTNVKDFFNTGVTATNNVNFSKAGEAFSLRASYTNLDVKGLIPNSYLKRNTLNTNFSINLGSKIILSTSINYVQQSRNAENDDAYSNQSTGSFGSWFHRDLDINKLRELKDLRSPEGIYASWNHANPGEYTSARPKDFYGANYWFNPYTYFEKIQNPDNRDRIYGDASVTYKFNNDFNIRGSYRKNQLTTTSSQLYPIELENSANQSSFNPYENTGTAAYGVGSSHSNRQNYELVGTYHKKVKDFELNSNAGVAIVKTTARTFNLNTKGGINVPGLYSLGNSKNPITNSFRTDGNPETITNFKRRGIFVRADLGFKNMAFVEGTYRRDYASSEPADSKGIDTKSIGASFVLSDLVKNKSVLSYAKIRGSFGQILNTLNPYDLNTVYLPSAQLFNGNFLISEPNALVDPKLQGATNNEKEIGIETRFFKNRFGFSATYWDRTNKNFPVNVAVTSSTGYSSIRTNAGEIAKTGVDLQVFVIPVRKDNLEWNINATWGRLIKNEVVKIAPGITRITSASGSFAGSSAAYTVSEVGKPWGQMFGVGIKRNAAGVPVLTGDGFFIKQNDVNFGSVLPKYTGGVQSTLTLFKNFTMNVNVDFSYGGKFFSLSDHWGTFSGLTARTAGLNDKGIAVRDAIADGGGVHSVGVDTSGKTIDVYVDAFDYFHQFRSARISETFIKDLTFVKLREFSLGYKLPVERMGVSKYVKNATFSIIARNPWLIYAKSRDFDPSEISNVHGEDGQLPGTRSMGVNLKLGF
ncbi:MAG: SusC/RagA family TonB-linked outer membrane protein [Ferruginibacter sp.]